MQLTSITFNFFPLKFCFLLKMFCFPSQNMWTECKWKEQVILSKYFEKWTTLCPFDVQFLHPPVPSSVLEAYLLQCLSTYFLSHMQVTTNYGLFNQKYFLKTNQYQNIKKFLTYPLCISLTICTLKYLQEAFFFFAKNLPKYSEHIKIFKKKTNPA